MAGLDLTTKDHRSAWTAVALLAAAAVFLVGAGLLLTPLWASDGVTSAGPSIRARPTPAPTPTPSTQTSVDPSVPKPHPLDSTLKSRSLFAGGTIGQDIANAIPTAYANARLAKPRVFKKWAQATKTTGPLVASVKIGTDGDPMSKLRAFADLVNSAPSNSADVAIMVFNYQDIKAETNVETVFANYVETMNSLETANPDIAILYATVPVTSGNSWREVDAATVAGLVEVTQPLWQDNIARERFNTLLRQQYKDSGRLFDLAAIEARLGKGKVAAKEHENQWYYVLNPALSSDGRRLNAKGSTRLAGELMMLIEAAAKARPVD